MATTVKTIFDAVLPRIQQVEVPLPTIVDAINEATEIIFDRLFKRGSDLIRREMALSISAESNTVDLPGNFRGLTGRPFIVGEPDALLPATESDIQQLYGKAGTPTHYELRDDVLAVYPTPEADVEIVGRFYEFPTQATSLTSVVPFRGAFDRAYREAVVKVALFGPGVVIEPSFAAFLYDAVDEVLVIRQRHAPIRREIRDF